MTRGRGAGGGRPRRRSPPGRWRWCMAASTPGAPPPGRSPPRPTTRPTTSASTTSSGTTTGMPATRRRCAPICAGRPSCPARSPATASPASACRRVAAVSRPARIVDADTLHDQELAGAIGVAVDIMRSLPAPCSAVPVRDGANCAAPGFRPASGLRGRQSCRRSRYGNARGRTRPGRGSAPMTRRSAPSATISVPAIR